MSVAHDSRQNHLLAALPAADLARLQSHLKLVPLRLGLRTGHPPLPGASLQSETSVSAAWSPGTPRCAAAGGGMLWRPQGLRPPR
jgi:hypothetical protein